MIRRHHSPFRKPVMLKNTWKGLMICRRASRVSDLQPQQRHWGYHNLVQTASTCGHLYICASGGSLSTHVRRFCGASGLRAMAHLEEACGCCHKAEQEVPSCDGRQLHKQGPSVFPHIILATLLASRMLRQHFLLQRK